MFNKFTKEILEGAWFSTLGSEHIRDSLRNELLSHDITADREEEVVSLLKLL